MRKLECMVGSKCKCKCDSGSGMSVCELTYSVDTRVTFSFDAALNRTNDVNFIVNFDVRPPPSCLSRRSPPILTHPTFTPSPV